ncbi:hypothetical protein KC327_g39 [Hortaea werneckii]|nr:hypothetical protein KC327_g39 [Hortaea werneckii]
MDLRRGKVVCCGGIARAKSRAGSCRNDVARQLPLTLIVVGTNTVVVIVVLWPGAVTVEAFGNVVIGPLEDSMVVDGALLLVAGVVDIVLLEDVPFGIELGMLLEGALLLVDTAVDILLLLDGAVLFAIEEVGMVLGAALLVVGGTVAMLLLLEGAVPLFTHSSCQQSLEVQSERMSNHGNFRQYRKYCGLVLLGALLVVLTGIELVGACEVDSALVVLATGVLELAIELDGLGVRGAEEVMTELVLFASGMLLEVVWGIVALLVVLTTEVMEVVDSDAMLLVLLTTGGISVGPMEVVGMASLLVLLEKTGRDEELDWTAGPMLRLTDPVGTIVKVSVICSILELLCIMVEVSVVVVSGTRLVLSAGVLVVLSTGMLVVSGAVVFMAGRLEVLSIGTLDVLTNGTLVVSIIGLLVVLRIGALVVSTTGALVVLRTGMLVVSEAVVFSTGALVVLRNGALVVSIVGSLEVLGTDMLEVSGAVVFAGTLVEFRKGALVVSTIGSLVVLRAETVKVSVRVLFSDTDGVNVAVMVSTGTDELANAAELVTDSLKLMTVVEVLAKGGTTLGGRLVSEAGAVLSGIVESGLDIAVTVAGMTWTLQEVFRKQTTAGSACATASRRRAA